MNFENKNCFISGATGGLGTCLAKEFAKNKCNLFLTSRSHSKLKKLKDELSLKNNVELFFETGDLTSVIDLKRIAMYAIKKLKTIDILINNAGVFPVKELKYTSLIDYQNCFDVNVRAPFFFSKTFSKGMKKSKWGRIVNITSSSAYEGFKKTSLYCASKHALLGFTRSLLPELSEYDIRSYSVAPGSVKTEMGKRILNQNFDTFIDPNEIAKFIVTLISFDNEMLSDEIRINRFKE